MAEDAGPCHFSRTFILEQSPAQPDNRAAARSFDATLGLFRLRYARAKISP